MLLSAERCVQMGSKSWTMCRLETKFSGRSAVVQAEAHLTRPEPQQPPPAGVVRRRKPQRCMRCGKSRTGACHTRTATSITPEYCKVAEADRTPHWRVPPGYAVGDTRQKEKQGATAREWRKICKENGYEDCGWEGWGRRY